jgi:hypothetical protein
MPIRYRLDLLEHGAAGVKDVPQFRILYKYSHELGRVSSALSERGRPVLLAKIPSDIDRACLEHGAAG